MIEIRSSLLARAYTQEFEEIWGSATEAPDSTKSRFHGRKADNTAHKFKFNESLVELYFCPTDGATGKIVKAIETADYSIYFCIFAFSRGAATQSIASALKGKFQSGVSLAGVFDDWWNTENWSEYSTMGESWSPRPSVYLSRVEGGGKVHHKYMLIDADSVESDPIVITGSQNWSSSAEDVNDENTLIIHNAQIAQQYLQEFIARYREAGGD